MLQLFSQFHAYCTKCTSIFQNSYTVKNVVWRKGSGDIGQGSVDEDHQRTELSADQPPGITKQALFSSQEHSANGLKNLDNFALFKVIT